MSESEDIRGMSIRELLLEVRQDVKDIRQDVKNHIEKGHPNTPTRREMFAGLIAVVGVLLAAVTL